MRHFAEGHAWLSSAASHFVRNAILDKIYEVREGREMRTLHRLIRDFIPMFLPTEKSLIFIKKMNTPTLYTDVLLFVFLHEMNR